MATAFRLIIDGAQEVPPNASTKTAIGLVVFDNAATTATYEIVVTGIDFGVAAGVGADTPDPSDNVVSMHVHNAARGVNGAVVFGQIGPAQDADDLTYIKNADGTWTVKGVWELTDPSSQPLSNFSAALAAALPGADVPLYWNIHSAAIAAGEIRGQWVGLSTENGEAIAGTAANDLIAALGGNDAVTGADGNDRIEGGLGDDNLNGGNNIDTVDWSDATGAIVFSLNAAGGGLTANVAGIGQDTITAFENIIAGQNNDTINGNAVANVIDGGIGRDSIRAGGGGDTVRGGDEVGAGDIILAGDAGADRVFGGGGNDRIDGGADGDLALNGEAGNDTITGGDGDDAIDGGSEDDIIYGQAGRDTVSGNTGKDTIYGGDEAGLGDIALNGDAGDDHIQGGLGDDLLNGNDNNDKLFGDGGADTANGGIGLDRLEGGAGDDILDGQAGNDVMVGGTENDTMNGGADIDRLEGGAGDDTLDGGAQNDNLTGGTGLDTFNFEAATGSEAVFDFTDNVDTLRIDASYGFADAAAVVAATISSAGNARILLGGGNQIFLMGYIANGNTIASLQDDIVIA